MIKMKVIFVVVLTVVLFFLVCVCIHFGYFDLLNGSAIIDGNINDAAEQTASEKWADDAKPLDTGINSSANDQAATGNTEDVEATSETIYLSQEEPTASPSETMHTTETMSTAPQHQTAVRDPDEGERD